MSVKDEYLAHFGPNVPDGSVNPTATPLMDKLRQQAMDRVGELSAGERVSYSGGGRVDPEEGLKRAMRELYAPAPIFPTDAADRGEFPMFDGLLAYFPAALAWVSRCSWAGNQQHNPGEPMHWAMDKSTDHENKILRHLMESGTDDADGTPHSVKVAWRALALAQEDLMKRKGYGMPRNARRANVASGNPVNQSNEE